MRLSISVLIFALMLAGCTHTTAQIARPPAVAPEPDPPGRVARLSYISGVVSFRAAGTDDWTPAVLNRPLTSGDELWTDRDSRAELDLGHAFVRLDERTSAGVLNLDDQAVQIKLSEGVAQVHLRRLDEQDEFEIDAPQAAVSLLRTGEYRIEADQDGTSTTVITRTGQAEVTAPGQSFTVRAGQRARLQGAEQVTYDLTAAPPTDRFDSFCETRDRRAEKLESLQHVSPYVIGVEDLDEFGYWGTSPDYGPVWFPRAVVVDWAPYRFGHWVWIEPWGWTWIDDAPWGFAPFHYGRWVIVNRIWGWVPGPPRIRAVYAPALVVFVGGGPGLRYYFHVGVGLGVAWFPLGPREIYIPPYRASRLYVTNVNISHTVVVNQTNIWKTDMSRQPYVNRRVNGAVTAVPEDVFAGARPVGRAAVPVSPQEAAGAHIGGSAPPAAPTRRSLAAIPDGARPAPRPPDAATRRQVTVRRTPAAAPVPFDQKRETLTRDPGRPLDPGRVEGLRRQQTTTPPQYRQAPQAPRPAQTPTPQAKAPVTTPPQVRQPSGPPTVRQAPSPAPSQRQTENRRRGIEREQRPPVQQGGQQGGKSGTSKQPGKQPGGRGR
ncbi:MAG: FecR domain-containing protein [Acidobacteriia bacterium]|nr:FecR domain-containing protein [Terriglobia bacterium]